MMANIKYLWIVVILKLIYKRIGEDSLAKKVIFIEKNKCGGGENFWKTINVGQRLLGRRVIDENEKVHFEFRIR